MTNRDRPRNRAKCLTCGDVVESKHVHDFVTCKCGAISVDGGNEYHRRLWPGGKKDEFIEEMP